MVCYCAAGSTHFMPVTVWLPRTRLSLYTITDLAPVFIKFSCHKLGQFWESMALERVQLSRSTMTAHL